MAGALLASFVSISRAAACSRFTLCRASNSIDELGQSQAELAELLGSRSRASRVLARRRPLTVHMIYKISEAWKIPAYLLIRAGPYISCDCFSAFHPNFCEVVASPVSSSKTRGWCKEAAAPPPAVKVPSFFSPFIFLGGLTLAEYPVI